MQLDLKDIANAHAQARFFTGDTVTIQIFDKNKVDVTPTPPGNECQEFGTTGIFQWAYSNLATLPTEYEEYTWLMTNQTGLEQVDVDVFYDMIVPPTVFWIPFDAQLRRENGELRIDINKGDSWVTEIRVDTNAENVKVAVELTDLRTTIYKYTSNIVGGGDDQIKLVALGDTFQIFKLYLSGEETESFDSRYVDMAITIESDAGTQTIKKKIPFSETPAITINPIP